MLCLVQLSKRRDRKATDAEKLLSVRESCLCNYKSKTQVHERCFFLMKWNVICNAEDIFSCFRALLHITSLEFRAFWKASFSVRESWFMQFRSKTQAWKMFLSHEIKCYLQCRRQIFCFRDFLQASHVRASMHKITSLELLRTLMLCLVQLSKRRESKATDAEKLLSQWEKVGLCNFRSKLKYMKDVFSHEIKCYLQCRKHIFMF